MVDSNSGVGLEARIAKMEKVYFDDEGNVIATEDISHKIIRDGNTGPTPLGDWMKGISSSEDKDG